jgi:phospholipase/lecithinase/hemolysin
MLLYLFRSIANVT